MRSHHLTVHKHVIVIQWKRRDAVTYNTCKPDSCFSLSTSKRLPVNHVRGKRAAIFSRADLVMSGNWMSNSTTMSPRLLGSFEYGRPSPAIRRTVVGFIISGIFSMAERLPSVGTLIVTPPSIAYTKLFKHSLHNTVQPDLPKKTWCMQMHNWVLCQKSCSTDTSVD